MFRYLLIILGVIFIIRLIKGSIFIVTNQSMKDREAYMRKFQEEEKRRAKAEEGKVKIDYSSSDKSKNKKHDDGEYTDYEEVK